MRYIFVADLHLMPGFQPEQNEKLRFFLQSFKNECAKVFFLGDLFHCWFEKKNKGYVGDYTQVLEILSEAKNNGLSLHHIIGNRDFIVGTELEKLGGITCTGLDFGLVIDNYKIQLIHGDSFCTKDLGYRLMQFFFIGSFGRFVWSLLPWFFARKIALRVQQRPKCLKNCKPKEKFSIQDKTVKKYMLHTGAEAVVCGHIHFCESRAYNLAGLTRKLIVVPPWGVKGEFVEFTGNKFRLQPQNTVL